MRPCAALSESQTRAHAPARCPVPAASAADPAGINYDEDKVRPYTLPDPLVLNAGVPVRDAATWRAQRRPALLGLNYFGNPCVNPDPGTTMSTAWMRANPEFKIVHNRATEGTRGAHASRWDVENVVARGYATVTRSPVTFAAAGMTSRPTTGRGIAILRTRC